MAFLASNVKATGYLQDPAFIYRCENLGHALRAHGLDVDWGHARAWRMPPRIDCVVVHRPRVSFHLWRLVRRLRDRGVHLVADVDDLVFDESLACFSPAVRNGRVALWRQARRFSEHRAAIRWFDHIQVSTEALAAHAERCFPGKPVTVLHNAVHWHWRRMPHAGRDSATQRVIAYLPGTRSHDRDFAMIADPLTGFLRANPDVRLRVTGPIAFRLDVPPSQIERGDKVPFADYDRLFRDVWVNLAPLEDTPFNACKSALKALEAGFWDVPTLCSPNPDYQRLATAGALIAATPSQWAERLEALRDGDEYRRVTGQLRDRTVELADINRQATLFVTRVLGGGRS